MNNELIAQVWESTQRVARYCWRFLRRYAVSLLGSAVVVLTVAFAWATYRDLATKRLTLLVGPAGGTTMRDARLIKERLEKAASSWYGPACHVRLEATEGYEENRRRISQDGDGQIFGFAHDGFGSAVELDKVRVLLPLDKTHLHIIVRRPTSGVTALPVNSASAPSEAPAESAQPLRDPKIALFSGSLDRLAPGRVYLGPPDSGTRQLAEAVLKYYGHNADRFPTFGIASWSEMRAALKTGAIDVAFCAGPKNSPVIQQIADDNDCVLVGLNGDREAICQDCAHLEPSQFVARSYNKDFCAADCHTIASRRVLLCSPAMSDKDAYLISKIAFDSLRNLGPDVGFPTVQNTENYRNDLRYELHNGAVLFSQNKGAPYFLTDWIRTSNYVLITVAVFLATEIFRKINSRAKQKDAKPGLDKKAAANATVGSDPLDVQCRNLLLELQNTSWGVTGETCTQWLKQANAARHELSTRQSQGNIDPPVAAVIQGMLREINSEIDLHRRSQSTAPRRRKGQNTRA